MNEILKKFDEFVKISKDPSAQAAGDFLYHQIRGHLLGHEKQSLTIARAYYEPHDDVAFDGLCASIRAALVERLG